MHQHQRPKVEYREQADGYIATVTMEDRCQISFIAPRKTDWNGGWPVYRGTDAGWGDADIDAARRFAFPEHR
jgi:hypothetical protein